MKFNRIKNDRNRNRAFKGNERWCKCGNGKISMRRRAASKCNLCSNPYWILLIITVILLQELSSVRLAEAADELAGRNDDRRGRAQLPAGHGSARRGQSDRTDARLRCLSGGILWHHGKNKSHITQFGSDWLISAYSSYSRFGGVSWWFRSWRNAQSPTTIPNGVYGVRTWSTRRASLRRFVVLVES